MKPLRPFEERERKRERGRNTGSGEGKRERYNFTKPLRPERKREGGESIMKPFHKIFHKNIQAIIF